MLLLFRGTSILEDLTKENGVLIMIGIVVHTFGYPNLLAKRVL